MTFKKYSIKSHYKVNKLVRIKKLGAQAGRSSMLRYIRELVLATYFESKFQFRINSQNG